MSDQGENGNTLRYRVAQLERDQEKLERKVDRLNWLLASAVVGFGATMLTIALTLLTGHS